MSVEAQSKYIIASHNMLTSVCHHYAQDYFLTIRDTIDQHANGIVKPYFLECRPPAFDEDMLEKTFFALHSAYADSEGKYIRADPAKIIYANWQCQKNTVDKGCFHLNPIAYTVYPGLLARDYSCDWQLARPKHKPDCATTKNYRTII